MTELPKKPERPLDSDCCGQGCDPCILDLYAEELKIWEEECRLACLGERRIVADLTVVEHSGPVLSQTEYREFIVDQVTQVTHDTYRYQFLLPSGKTLGLKAGQHVIIRGNVDGETITRQYTPVSDVDRKSEFELLIKIYDEGRMSQCIRDWKIGSIVHIRGPCGNFLYLPNQYKKIVMLAVGTGIAPMSQIIQTVLNNEDDMTIIHLLYGVKTYQDILMKSELDDWSRYWNFSCTYYLSQEKEGSHSYRYGDKVTQGHITDATVKSVMDDICDNYLVLICGTRSFEQDMLKYLKELGVSEEKYHKF